MELTLATLLMLLLMVGVGVLLLSTVAGVIRTETAFWDTRCEIEKLRYSYQLQLMRAEHGDSNAHDDGTIIEVEPIEQSAGTHIA